MTEKFNVTGMTCSACSAHVEKSVKKLNGVKSVNVNLLQNNMHVDFDETAVSVDDIINAVVSGGYGASVAGKKQEKKDNKIDNEISNMKFRLIVSLVCLVPLMYIYVGLAVFERVSWCRKRNNICTYANAVDVADNVCQQKILYNRF